LAGRRRLEDEATVVVVLVVLGRSEALSFGVVAGVVERVVV
jgi:hypothetical protein